MFSIRGKGLLCEALHKSSFKGCCCFTMIPHTREHLLGGAADEFVYALSTFRGGRLVIVVGDSAYIAGSVAMTGKPRGEVDDEADEKTGADVEKGSETEPVAGIKTSMKFASTPQETPAETPEERGKPSEDLDSSEVKEPDKKQSRKVRGEVLKWGALLVRCLVRCPRHLWELRLPKRTQKKTKSLPYPINSKPALFQPKSLCHVT